MVSTPQNSRYRRAHDPYNDMETAITRPQNIARQQLSDAEKTAANSATDPSKSNSTSISQRLANSLRQSEQNQTSTAFTSNFRNSVSGKSSFKANGKSRIFKRFAPLTVITAILFGGGAFFYGAQSLLAPHLSSLYTNATDVQFTSYSMRNQRLFKYLMDGGDQIKISNFTKKYTTFTPYMKKRLQANGIEVGYLDTDGNFNTDQIIANKSTVLKYNIYPIVKNLESNIVKILDKKYPYIISNGITDYYSATIEATFLTTNQTKIDCSECELINNYTNINGVNNNNKNISFTLNFMDFLVNKRPKLIKTNNGLLWIVDTSTSNPQITEEEFNTYKTTFTIVQIADTTETANYNFS